MRFITKTKASLSRPLNLDVRRTAQHFWWRAFYIAVPMAALAASVLSDDPHGAGLIFAVPSALALAVATANGIWPLRAALEALEFGDELGAVVWLVLALIAPVLLVLCSPFVLLWALVRAARLSLSAPAR